MQWTHELNIWMALLIRTFKYEKKIDAITTFYKLYIIFRLSPYL